MYPMLRLEMPVRRKRFTGDPEYEIVASLSLNSVTAQGSPVEWSFSFFYSKKKICII